MWLLRFEPYESLKPSVGLPTPYWLYRLEPLLDLVYLQLRLHPWGFA